MKVKKTSSNASYDFVAIFDPTVHAWLDLHIQSNILYWTKMWENLFIEEM